MARKAQGGFVPSIAPQLGAQKVFPLLPPATHMSAFRHGGFVMPHANTLQEMVGLSATTQQFALDQESSLHSTRERVLAIQLPTSQSPKKPSVPSYGLATLRGGVLRRIQQRALRLRYE